MVADSAPGSEQAAEAEKASDPGPLADHVKLACERLGAPAARPYLDRLRRALVEEDGPQWKDRAPPDLVGGLAGCPCDQDTILDLFVPVRLALLGLPDALHVRAAACDAAIALYFLLVCRAVNVTAAARDGGAFAHTVVMPDYGDVDVANMIAMITATALFGGALYIKGPNAGALPQVDGVYEVRSPGHSDLTVSDFERAVYLALFADHEDTPRVAQGDGELKPEHRDRAVAALAWMQGLAPARPDDGLERPEAAGIRARVRTLRRMQRKSFALIVREERLKEVAPDFAARGYRVPILLPDSALATSLLGMDVSTLVAEIREFWRELQTVRTEGQRGSRPSRPHQGEQKMPESGPKIVVQGPAAISFGSKSLNQVGDHNSATHTEQHGVDPEQMVALLEALREEIASLDPGRARERLEGHLTAVQAEVAKPDGDRDRGVIKGALDAIETIADALDDGGRIMEHLAKAAPWLPAWFPGSGAG